MPPTWCAALLRRWPDAVIDAFGGPALAAAGATVRFPMERYTVIGFFEVLGKIPAHLRLLRELPRDFRAGRYDLVIPRGLSRIQRQPVRSREAGGRALALLHRAAALGLAAAAARAASPRPSTASR